MLTKEQSQTPPIWVSFTIYALGTIALLPSFALWCSRIAAQRIAEWDTTLTAWCHLPDQRRAWVLFSRLGDGWLYLLYFLALRYYAGEHAQAQRLGISCFLAWGIGSALKLLVRRRRQNPIQRYRFLCNLSWSFPSQHAAVAVAFAFCLWPNPGAIILAGAICAARVLGGAHYVGDVLVGILVGLLAGRLA